MAIQHGSRRLVVGARYGLRDWLSQRVTATLLALFTLVLLAQLLFGGPLGYERWAAIFSAPWMKALTFVAFLALAWHAWVGMRDILMDYVNATAVRLLLYLAVVVALAASVAWLLVVLWSLT